MLVFVALNMKSTISINNDHIHGKIFGFRNAILNALHCKIHCPNKINVCSLPFVKCWEFNISIFLEISILIKIPKFHDTKTKYNCDHKHISITLYINDSKHTFMLVNQRVLQCNILAMTLANRSRR
jgi:hypothetical protein